MVKKKDEILRSTHTGELNIGHKSIPCAVLEDGTRVLTQRGLYSAIGRSRSTGGLDQKGGAQPLPRFLAPANLRPFISKELERASTPIKFKPLKGSAAYGYRAEILPEVCDVFLEARNSGDLKTNQMHIAKQCELLVRSFAKVGIIALVDEATGYQYDRARHALEEILDKFISKELRKWAKTFPDEFYQEMFRLRNWQYVPFSVKRPGVVGRYTNDLVYERLAPGVLEELKRKTPKTPSGHRRHRLFQWLTEDVGHPRLREHLTAVIALMRASSKWSQFYRMLQRALPKYGETIPMDFPESEN